VPFFAPAGCSASPTWATASGYVEGDRDGQPVTLFTSVPDQRITVTRR
jgi:hypothetical protein